MLKLKIISPDKVLFSGEVERIIVPGMMGRFEVLTNHAPIISILEKGSVVYDVVNGERSELQISGGFIEVQKNRVNLCVEL
ncbi:MAG: ATP synthase F1 subunit epsilon [Prevotellaceae bacterium]|nr:ATP synthase F1 subunit epsilon [Prevotellaceae bacterium]MDY3366307.1 ATP synthase F1 subunit epsilon [Prevotella sp.]